MDRPSGQLETFSIAMDLLTHLFLPLIVVVSYRPDLFTSPRTLSIGFVGILPDADKLLGVTGLFHSLVVLVPVGIIIIGLSRRAADRRFGQARVYGNIAILLLMSHLVLDFVDGGPVTFLYPVIETGIGLEYPMRLLLGEGVLNIEIRNPLVQLRFDTPRSCVVTFTPLDSFGVASAALFWTVYAVTDRNDGSS